MDIPAVQTFQDDDRVSVIWNLHIILTCLKSNLRGEL
jgi:hypothetical protein